MPVRGRATSRTCVRGLIAAVAAVALLLAASGSPRAQITAPPPAPAEERPNRTVQYIVTGLIVGTVLAIIARAINDAGQPNTPPPPPGPPTPPPSPSFERPRFSQQQQPTQPRQSTPRARTLRTGFHVPADTITSFVPNEVLVDSTMSPAALDNAAAALGLTRLESVRIALTGRTLHRLRINDGTPVREKIPQTSGQSGFNGAQANFLYQLTQAGPLNAEQYAPTKLKIPDAHSYASGTGITVAVIDSAVDTAHPDLSDAIVGNHNATGDAVPPHPHGTGMAGAIAGRRTLLSIAPRVRLVTGCKPSIPAPTRPKAPR